MTEQDERAEVWRAITEDANVVWCNGRGCASGSFVQHEGGFASATKVHLASPPDPEDRVAFHRAVELVGRVVAGRTAGSTPRERSVDAFDFATEAMRERKISVPRALLSDRPSPEAPERRDEGTRAKENAGEPESGSEVPDVETSPEGA